MTTTSADRSKRLALIEITLNELEQIDPDEIPSSELPDLQVRLDKLRKRVSKLSYKLRYREVVKDGVSQYARR